MNNLDYEELYGVRLLVFQETEPQSNKYRQVLLDKEQFKKVSFDTSKLTGKKIMDNIDECTVMLSDEIYTLPDLKEIN